MKMTTCLLVFFTLFSLFSTLLFNTHVYSQQEFMIPLHVVVLYLPNSDINKLSQKLAERNISLFYMPVELDGPRNYDYYLYWMITGMRPESDYKMGKDAYIHVDQELLVEMWNRTVFIDVPLVDPWVHNASMNPLYNLTNNFVSPRIFNVPINGSVYWDELETNVFVTRNLSEIVIMLERFNRTYTISSVGGSVGPSIIEIYNSTALREGGYYIMLYLVNMTDDSVVLFTPGVVSDIGWASPRFGKVPGYNVHWSLLSKQIISQLTEDAIRWWFNQTLITMDNYLATAITTIGVPVYFVYAPYLEIAMEMLPRDLFEKVENDAYYWIAEFVDRTITKRLDNCTFIVFNPFSDLGMGYLAYVNAMPFTRLNPSITTSQAVSLILSLSKLYPLSFQLILDEMFNAKAEATTLSLKIKDLERLVNNLNSTIASLNVSLAFCESERNILDARVKAIDMDLKRAEDLKRAAYTYVTMGIAVTFVIGISIGTLLLRSVGKARQKR